MGRCSDARVRLLETASGLLHRRGYTAVSVSEICEVAGLKKGSFYHFFASKQLLALAAIDGYAAANRERMQAVFSGDGSIRDKLQAMFAGIYEDSARCHREGAPLLGCPLGNLAGEMSGRDREITAKLASIFSEWRQGFEQLLTQGVADGEFVVPDIPGTAEALVVLIEGAALMARTMGDPTVLRRMGDRVISSLGTHSDPVLGPSATPAA